jgi:hypothetical protein
MEMKLCEESCELLLRASAVWVPALVRPLVADLMPQEPTGCFGRTQA